MAPDTPGVHEMENWFRETGLGHVLTPENAAISAGGMDGVVSGGLEDAGGSAQRQQQPESQTLTMLASAEEMAAGGYGANGLLDGASSTSLLTSNVGLPVSSSLPHSSTSAVQQYWHTRSPLGPSDMMEMNPPFSATQTHVEESEREEHDGKGGQGNCYIRILRRLTRLEEVLERSPPMPPLDIILSAERDTRVLKDTLFACGGHSPHSSNIFGLVMMDRERSRGTAMQTCLQAHSSSLVVLVLLADRVTSLLEGLFDHAAANSYGMHRAFQTSSASLLLGASPELSSHKGEWRMARSLRGSYPRSINCPVPEASCRLTVGKYEVDGEVESRVMKHILRRRVRELQRMLGEVEEYTEPVSSWRRASRGSQDEQGRPEGERAASLLGDRRGRRGLAPPMARAKVLDLRRRVELLQGRLELAE